MIAETGLFALILALFAAAVQSTVPLLGAARGDASWMKLGRTAASAQFVLMAGAFAALVWGSHDASILLWTFTSALYGMLVAVFGRSLSPTLQARVLSVQGMIACGFLLFILTASNPFERALPSPFEGQGFNRLLQAPGFAVQQLFLHFGNVGFSVAFAFGIAALIEGRVDAAWARWVRRWTLVSWSTLTLGIVIGSWWSYYTLGWGGYWAWDPAENTSLMSWLAGTALLHSASAVEKREVLKGWAIFLAILTFCFSLLASLQAGPGALTGVHAFANAPARLCFILLLLSIASGGSLYLFARRAGTLKASATFSPISREGGLVLNNLFLSAAAGTVLLGALTPLIADALGLDKLSAGAPWYNLVIPLLLAPMLLLMPVAPLLTWKRGNAQVALKQLWFAGLVTMIAVIVTLIGAGFAKATAALVIGIGAWIITGSATEWGARTGLLHSPISEVIHRAWQMPRAAHGMTLAHFGLGVVIIGIAVSSSWQKEQLLIMRPGQSVAIAGYNMRLLALDDNVRGPNYTAGRATFLVERNGSTVAVLQPERRLYGNLPGPKCVPAIHTDAVSDLYVVLGEPRGKSGHVVHAFHNPLVPWIFYGAIMMVLGGIVSLSDRRGAAKRTPPLPAPGQRAKSAGTRSKPLLLVLPPLIFLVLAGMYFWRLQQSSQGNGLNMMPSALINKPAPNFELPPLYPGRPGFKTSDLKGHVTLINFFASWCVPCRAEHPMLKVLESHGIVLVGVNYRDKPDAGRAFLAELGDPYGVVTADRDGRTAIDFGTYGVPESYLIDKSGVVRFKQSGPLTDEVIRKQILPLAEKLN